MNKKIVCLILWIANIIQARTTTFISPHSPTDNIARYLVGWEQLIDNTKTHNYVTVGIIPEVTQSFRQDRVAQCLFGNIATDHKRAFTVSGSLIENRGPTDWLADYFGLPPDFVSTIHVKPTVNNSMLNLSIYFGLNNIMPGLYAFIQGPLQYTRWDLNFHECLVQTGTHGYDPGYFNNTGIERSSLLASFTDFMTGHVPQAEGIIYHPLAFGKVSCRPLRKIRWAELQGAIGYNFLAQPSYHIGFFIFGGIPGGNKPTATFLFEPLIGNGHLWQLGGGFTGHALLWCNEETDEHVSLYAGCMVSHLFKTTQRRSFDLCGKPNSRYMLAAQVGTPIVDNLVGLHNGTLTSPDAQFKHVVSPVINLTTSPITISIPWYLDAAIMLSYSQCHFTWSFGYGIWARACDQISRIPCSQLDNTEQQWVLKGDAQVIGFETITNAPIPLSTSQNNATINTAGNIIPSSDTTNSQNFFIDNPSPAFSDSTNSGIFSTVLTMPNGVQQINTSIQPVLLSADDIDINSARTRGITQKIFGHFSYQWINKYNTIPYLGFGAQAELAPQRTHLPDQHRASCVNCAFTFWSIWLKGGAQFN